MPAQLVHPAPKLDNLWAGVGWGWGGVAGWDGDYKDGSLKQSILMLRFEWWDRNEVQNN